jgi:L-2-hydroxyglutarate oxidase LhgO
MQQIDVAVIGAGVIGLAAARAIARHGRSVCALERHARAGSETSTRNSGVIHAGIYYPAGSLKATLCVRGRHLLYQFCAEHHVPYTRCGKLIVANHDGEVPELERLLARGNANGVEGLVMVDRSFCRQREPHVPAVAALFSPATGVVDPDALVRTLQRTAETEGAIVLPGTSLEAARITPDGIELRTSHETLIADQVVNAAGLYADDVARLLEGETFTIYPCRGEYAALTPARRHLARALVYPLPHRHGLGVHIVKTVHGDVWLGPTATYQERKDDYESNRLSLESFLEPTRRLLDDVTIADLRLAGSGIRAKLHPESQSFADFMIRRDAKQRRVVHAAGIESPGLTSCLAVGEMVADLIEES